jgi:hypothetical protein
MPDIIIDERQRDDLAATLRQRVREDIADLRLASEYGDLAVPGVTSEEHGRTADAVGAMFHRSLVDHLGQLDALHPTVDVLPAGE